MVDEEAAPVVELIFQLCGEGNGPGKIARTVTDDEIEHIRRNAAYYIEEAAAYSRQF